jgi:hypothetical protein
MAFLQASARNDKLIEWMRGRYGRIFTTYKD